MNSEESTIFSSSMIAMLAGCFLLVIVFALILEQIGSPQLVVSLWLMSFAIGIYLFSGMFGKTMRFSTFQTSDKALRPMFGGIAIAAAVVSGNVLILMPGNFYAVGTAFLATYLGILIGVALSSVLFSANMARSSVTSIGSLLFPQQSSRLFLLISSLIVIGCSICLLFAQLRLLELFVESFFGIAGHTAVNLVMLTLTICLVFGGMQALGVSRVLGFSAMAIALFVPLIWLSYYTTGNPIPHLSFGYGASEPILEIDREMIEAGFARVQDVFNPVLQTTKGGITNHVITTIVIAFGIATLPHLLQHYFTVKKGRAARQTGIWGFWLVLAFLSVIPAIALFAKLNIYTSILGLQISELIVETPWLFDLSGRGTAPLIEICGFPVSSTSEVLQACNRSADSFIGIQDIDINPDYLLIGIGFLAELPPILTTLLILAAFLCILTTVDGLLLVSANSVTVDIYNRIFRPLSPPGIKLFMNRFFLMAIAGLIALFYPGVEADPKTLFTAAIVIGCSTLFPVLVSRMWASDLKDLELGLSMVSSFIVSLSLLVLTHAGPDLNPLTRDELILVLPGVDNVFPPITVGVIGLITFILVAIVLRLVRTKTLFTAKREETGASA